MKTVNAPFLVLLSVLLASASATPDEDAATHDKDVLMCVKVAKAKANPKADSHAVFNQKPQQLMSKKTELQSFSNIAKEGDKAMTFPALAATLGNLRKYIKQTEEEVSAIEARLGELAK
ncbi:unnamed protein product [Tilletia caries]|nr:unnamed protein product [Tilletia caries]